MILTPKQIYDLSHMNVAAQNIDFGQLLSDIIEQNGEPINEAKSFAMSNMNVAAQNVQLGTLLNNIMNQNGSALTEKQIYDLNNMNVAAQNVQLGTLLNDMMNADNYEKGGKLNPLADVAQYPTVYNNFKGKDMYIVIDGGTYIDESLNLPNQAQNDENPPLLHITVQNAEFSGATVSGKNIYVTNVKELIIRNCKFIDNNISDYAVDVNLCTIQDAEITIEDCIFINTGIKSAIKIAQRMGDTDHPTDITVKQPATISKVIIDDCYFDHNVVDLTIGTTPKGDDTLANTSTGNYPVYVYRNQTKMTMAMPYLVDKDCVVPKFVLSEETNYYKSNDGKVTFN